MRDPTEKKISDALKSVLDEIGEGKKSLNQRSLSNLERLLSFSGKPQEIEYTVLFLLRQFELLGIKENTSKGKVLHEFITDKLISKRRLYADEESAENMITLIAKDSDILDNTKQSSISNIFEMLNAGREKGITRGQIFVGEILNNLKEGVLVGVGMNSKEMSLIVKCFWRDIIEYTEEGVDIIKNLLDDTLMAYYGQEDPIAQENLLNGLGSGSRYLLKSNNDEVIDFVMKEIIPEIQNSGMQKSRG